MIVPPKLKQHLNQQVTTIAICWKVKLTNNHVLGFTNLDQDLIIDNVTYEASAGFVPSKVDYYRRLPQNFQIETVINSNKILKEEVIKGKFDDA